MQSIRNIYCVGRNYGLHAAELGNAVPDEPMIFTKPTYSLVEMQGQTLTLPGNKGEVHYETEIVLHVGKAYKPGITVDELIDKMALGIDLTLRDVQSVIKKKGYPWLPAKGFIKSAPISEFRPFPGLEIMKQTEFSLVKNGVEAQRGNINDMIFNFQVIIDYIAENYGLGEGDIIFTGTPEGVAALKSGDKLELVWGEETFGQFSVDLQ